MLGKNLGQERLLWHFLEHYKEIFTLFFKAFQRGVKKYVKKKNPLMTNVPHHIGISQLICIADQVTGFYMMGNTDR